MLKKSDRAIKRAIRDIEKERKSLEAHEKKMQGDIKKCAQKGQMVAARHIAKDVVRTRSQITKSYQMSAQLQTVGNKLMTMKAMHATTEGMSNVCKAMVMMNKQFDIPALNKMAQEFQMESDKLEMMGDLTNDLIDDVMQGGEEDEDAAADEILNSVMDAEGIRMNDQFSALDGMAPVAGSGQNTGPQMVAMGAGGPPGGPPPPGGAPPPGGGGGDAGLSELEARLNALRKS